MREGAGLFFPEGFGEEHHDGEYFQSPDEHEQREEHFGRFVQVGEVVHRPDAPEAGTDVAQAGGDGTAGGGDVLRQEGHEETPDEEDNQVEDGEAHDAGHDIGVDAFAVVFGGDDGVGVDDAFEFGEGVFEEELEAYDFEPAGGGACGCADDDEEEDDHAEEGRPEEVVGGGESCGGHDGDDLEEGVAEAFFDTAPAVDVEDGGDDEAGAEGDGGVEAEFVVLE